MQHNFGARLSGLIASIAALGVAVAADAQREFHPTVAPAPPPDCQAHVAYDRDMTLPGYLLPTSAGPTTCIPFTTAAAHPPAGDKSDFYVDEFTDAKLRERWIACKADKACYDRVYKQVVARHPPNKEYNLKDPHGRLLLGKIEERGADTDLSAIRRPGYFGRAPYNEPIAAADADTYILEFTALVEAYERLHQNMSGDIKIRGWYIRGAGIDDGKGGKRRALIIASGGGGDRVTAIDDPIDKAYVIDPKSGETIPNDDWPNATTGVKGQAVWRQVWANLHQAGFDVLALDRRGVGISGGFSDTNTLQQGHDLLNIVASLRTGEGMRGLTPSGELVVGRAAADAARGRVPRAAPDQGLPVLFMGSSRGTMSSGWAMTINYDEDCSYDLPTISCKPPLRDPSIKGAILVADFSSGVGYLEGETTSKDDGRGPGRDRGLFIGGIELENNIVFFPSSATLAGMHKWPSAFFARGLWCYADGLEGEMDAYSRVKGLKDLVVVRGPHAFETWPPEEKARVQERMIAYASAVVLDHKSIQGRRTWTNMKELVATTSDVWEPSTHPTVVVNSVAQIPIAPATQRADVFPRPPVSFPAGVEALPDVEYSNIAGYRPLLLDLYRPRRGAGSHPLVVVLHGGGWRRGDSRGIGAVADFPATLAMLAARGYVVASVNYRLSAEARFPAQIQDVRAAIAFLRANASSYDIDPGHVLVWGASAGGHLAALAATSCSDPAFAPLPSNGRQGNVAADSAKRPDASDCVQAAVIWYGVLDLAGIPGKDAEELLGCRPEACAHEFAAGSPGSRVSKSSVPMLLVHGLTDAQVPVDQSRDMAAKLQQVGVGVETLFIPDVGHGLIGTKPALTRDATHLALQRTFDFIDGCFARHPPSPECSK